MNKAYFIYYFKKNHRVHKNKLSYLDLVKMLELNKKNDKKGEPYIKAHTYQLQWMQEFLLNNKELQIFKCNVCIDNQVIL
jgi:hypothetical protein